MSKKMALIAIMAAFVIFSFTACGKDKTPVSTTGETKVIAVAQLKQETNIFSPVETSLVEFEAQGLLYGRDILSGEIDGELKGFMASVDDFGYGRIEVVPILKASAVSGGPIKTDVYEQFKKDIVDGLKNMEKLDGIYLILHGAMGVEGMYDPEGDLLLAVREAVGYDLPIGVSYDLHANITKAKVELSTFIVGFQTNPHRDQYEAGYTSGEILVKTVHGEVNPVMSYRKMKLLKGGGMNIDFLPPMNSIFQWMKKTQKQSDVLSISNFMVHVWLDEPELGWSTVVVTDNKPELADKLAEELADRNWEVRDYHHSEGYTPSEAIKIARDMWFSRMFGTTVFCDVSDAVGAGAPGENTWILKSILEEAQDLVSYIPIKDSEGALAAYNTPIGEEITLTLGGKLEKTYNRPLEVTGRVINKAEGASGKIAVLQSGKTHIIITEFAASVMYPKFFTDLGLNLWKADIVVVKNLFPFRIWFLQYNRKTLDVMTPGTTTVDIYKLGYENINRPIYPFDNLDDWR